MEQLSATGMSLINLSDPNFHESIGIYPKWRIGDSVGGGKNEIYPYYDADQIEEILDAVCGISGWGCEYREVAKMLFCTINIRTQDGEIIEKSDAGGARASRKKNIEDVDKLTFEAKTAATGAFVRAAAKLGIGRHLSLLPKIHLDNLSGTKVRTPKGEILEGAQQLSAWCNKTSPSLSHLMAVWHLNKTLFANNEQAKELISELKELIENQEK